MVRFACFFLAVPVLWVGLSPPQANAQQASAVPEPYYHANDLDGSPFNTGKPRQWLTHEYMIMEELQKDCHSHSVPYRECYWDWCWDPCRCCWVKVKRYRTRYRRERHCDQQWVSKTIRFPLTKFGVIGGGHHGPETLPLGQTNYPGAQRPGPYDQDYGRQGPAPGQQLLQPAFNSGQQLQRPARPRDNRRVAQSSPQHHQQRASGWGSASELEPVRRSQLAQAPRQNKLDANAWVTPEQPGARRSQLVAVKPRTEVTPIPRGNVAVRYASLNGR